jgi:hypothetical protein
VHLNHWYLSSQTSIDTNVKSLNCFIKKNSCKSSCVLDKVSSSEINLSYDYSMNNFCYYNYKISKVIEVRRTVYFPKYIYPIVYFLTLKQVSHGLCL